MNGKRESNYDLLRVIAMLGVIVTHVSATWISGFSKYVAGGGEVSNLMNPIAACFYNVLLRFVVPCFIMLSGAFIMADNRNVYYRRFYEKQLKKIVIPTVVFTVIYILYRIIFVSVTKQSQPTPIFESVFRGLPFYHMWYMYMLIGVYLLAPFAVRYKNSVSQKSFLIVSFAFLILASISMCQDGDAWLNWDLGQAFEYLSYFMVGYALRKNLKKNNILAVLLIVLGFAVASVTAMIQYKYQILEGLAESKLEFPLVKPYSPLVVLSSVLIFAGFSMLKLKRIKIIEKLSARSLTIYLFHAGVWHLISELIGKSKLVLSFNNSYWIPIFALIVFLISLILTEIYNKVEAFFHKRKKKKSAEEAEMIPVDLSVAR